MAEKQTILTEEGLRKLEEELEFLKTERRSQVAERIKQAIDFGDISENSEYEDAKNEQAFIEGKIADLEKKLRNVEIIKKGDADVVTVGSTVVLKDLEMDDVAEYTIVGSTEADPMEFRISNESPVGAAILGQRVGGIVEVHVPAGVLKYQIMQLNGK
ncbi:MULTISPECIES: transcription elongation factor GreA [Sporomusaceae]|uniref:transcription elongation factor GreA n=1 Tax=Sporomusaceae TaxID=1843490 RepID=UPI00036668B6|nr:MULTISPECIES: transcription elongation factor GreA [Sporomusaceae]